MSEQNEAMDLIRRARSQARNENFTKFFGKHSKTLKRLAFALAAVLIVFLIFNFVQNSREESFSEILHQSLIDQQTGDLTKSKEALKKIYETKSAPSGVWSLASMRYAAFLLEERKNSDAAKIYQEVNQCYSCDTYIKDLAGLLAVKTWISDDDEIQKADLTSRVEKIEKSNKFLKYQVAEQRAFLEMQRNNLEKSYEIFDSIAKSHEASEGLRSRAADGLKMVIAKGFEPKVEVIKVEEK
jgi:hypothetical protein